MYDVVKGRQMELLLSRSSDWLKCQIGYDDVHKWIFLG
jgi:hypothetical protein